MAGGREGVGCPDVAAHERLPRGCGRAHGPQTTVSGGFHLRFPAPRIALGLTEFRVPTERAGLSAFISSYIYKECGLVCLGPWGLTRWNLPRSTAENGRVSGQNGVGPNRERPPARPGPEVTRGQEPRRT